MLPDAYGCVVANRFGNLLDDEADPFDLISEVETEKEKRKKKKKKEEDEKKNKQKKPGQRESQKDRRVPFAPEPQDPVPGERVIVKYAISPARICKVLVCLIVKTFEHHFLFDSITH